MRWGTTTESTPTANALLAAALRTRAKRYARLAAAVAAGKEREGLLHDARVASRRLLAVIRVLRAIGIEEAAGLRKRPRRLAKALARARDLEVLSALLVARADKPALRALALRWAREQAVEWRRVHKRLRGVRLEPRTSELDATLAAVAAAPDLGARLASVLQELEQSVLRGLDTAATESPQRLHERRLAFKRFRYAVEIVLAARRDAESRALLRRLKRWQNELGRIQDLAVLRDMLLQEATAHPRGAQGLHAAAAAAAADEDAAISGIWKRRAAFAATVTAATAAATAALGVGAAGTAAGSAVVTP
jgi:CHAD domain-containing protein